MKLRSCLALLFAVLLTGSLARAADLVGHWTAEFDSQIGAQKYTYDFKADGEQLTGKATYEHSMGKGESPLSAIKVSGDDVTFVEKVSLEGMELVITYTGKIAGDEMKLTRQVGDFATEQIVAKRGTSSTAKPAGEK